MSHLTIYQQFLQMKLSSTNTILSCNEKAEQAEWVAYELKKDYVTNSDCKRPYFIEDPKVKSAFADWRNYKNSG